MNKKLALFAKLTMTAVVLLVVLNACSTGKTNGQSSNNMMNNAAKASQNKGEAAPLFALKDLNGNTVQLADFKGQKVYIKYWASWCSICLAGLDDLNTLAGQDNGFKVISIVTPNYKGEQSEKDFTEWFKGRQYGNLTVLLDADGVWAKKFGVRGYPSSYFIGSDGILAKSSPGHVENDVIISSMKGIH